MIKFNLLEIYKNPSNYSELFIDGHVIYGIHNLLNNKWYIGMTNTNIYYRFFKCWYGGHFGNYLSGSNSHLYNSMRKYGLENFELVILSRDPDSEEITFINKYDSYYGGYNNTHNGHGVNESTTSGYTWINDGIHEWPVLNPNKFPNCNIGRLNYHPRLNKTLFYDENGTEIVVPNEKVDEYQKLHPTHKIGRLTPWVIETAWVTNGIYDKRVKYSELDEFLKSNPEFKLGMAVGHTAGMVPVFVPGSGYTLISESNVDEFLSSHEGAIRKSPNEGRIHVTDGNNNYSIYKDEVDEFLSNNPGFKLGHSYCPTGGRRWTNNGKERWYVREEDLEQFLIDHPDYHIGFALK